jgi:predicted O-methyltransferase YrrM
MSTITCADVDRAMIDINSGWTSAEQARLMFNAVTAIRPVVSVEIGVYTGKGLVALGLAHKANGCGKVIGIDPWSRAAFNGAPQGSLEFQTDEHCEVIYQTALRNIAFYGLENFVEIIRAKSDDVTPPDNIGFIRIDGDHAEGSFRDVQRFCPKVVPGGILHLDDMNWTNGASSCGAIEWLEKNGWIFAYGIDTGAAYRKG